MSFSASGALRLLLGGVICLLTLAFFPGAAWAFEYRVCVRPPDVATNVAKWAYPGENKPKVITADNGTFLIKSSGYIVFVYDPWAPPSSVEKLRDKWPNLVCPPPPAPPKPAPVGAPPKLKETKPEEAPPKKEGGAAQKPAEEGRPPGVKDFVGEKPLTEEEKHFIRQHERPTSCPPDHVLCEEPILPLPPSTLPREETTLPKAGEGVLGREPLLPPPAESEAVLSQKPLLPKEGVLGPKKTAKAVEKTTLEKVVEEVVIGGAIFNLNFGEDLHRPDGKEFGIVGGMNADGPNDPTVQAVAAVLNFVPLSALADGFMRRVAAAGAKGEKVVLKEVSELSEEAAEELVNKYGEDIAQALAKVGAVGPYKVWKKFTANFGGRWQAHHILEKAKIRDLGLKVNPDMVPAVILSEAEHKEITADLALKTKAARTAKQLWEGYKQAYKKHPDWLSGVMARERRRGEKPIMREWVRIDFDGNDVPGGAQAILQPVGCGPDVSIVHDNRTLGQVFVYVTLYVDDERLPKLIDLLRRHGVEWRETRRDTYTEQELNDARLILVWTFPDCEVFGGPRVGTSYDMSAACPVCGTGARQTSALIIHEEDLPKLENRQVASTFYSDIIVTERVAEELEALGATGLSFRSVFARLEGSGRQIKLRWRQLCAARPLPPMAVQTTGIVPYRQCRSCGRGGYSSQVEVPPRVAYHARDLVGIDDVHTTWEWFGDYDFNGNVGEALFAEPWFLATPRVVRVLRAASGKEDFDWIPIRVVDG